MSDFTKLKGGAATQARRDGDWTVFGGPTSTFLGTAVDLEQAQRMIDEFGTPAPDVIDEARIS